MKSLVTAALLVAVATSSAWAAKPETVTVPMKDAAGKDVGTVTFVQGKNAIDVKIHLMDLPKGEHGIHVHAGSACTAPDFASAMGHLNPTAKKHGFASAEGHHAGDFPMSVKVGEDGKATATFHNADLSFEPTLPASLFGKTVVVHELADDQKTDPAGASGKRIACGVIPATAN